MGTLRRTVMAAGTLILLTAQQAAAQSEPRRGFWFSFGFGYGSANITCDDCSSGGRLSGTSGFLRLGGTLNQHVRLGAAIDGWTHSPEGVTESLGNLTGSIYYYPQIKTGFFVEGGAGLSSYRTDASPGQISGTGWGLTAGTGVDIRVGHQVWLTPRAAYSYGMVGNLNYSGGGVPFTTGWKQNLFSAGIGLTFH